MKPEAVDPFNEWFWRNRPNTTALRRTLLCRGGNVFLPIDIDEDLAAYIQASGRFFGPADVHLPGIEGLCHYMTELFWRQNRAKYTIFTGAARMDEVWVGHSWLMDKAGNPIETSRRQYLQYFGAPAVGFLEIVNKRFKELRPNYKGWMDSIDLIEWPESGFKLDESLRLQFLRKFCIK